jgi:outer membrane lipoprotein-sorting protein
MKPACPLAAPRLAFFRLAPIGTLFLPLLLTGCSLFPTTRKLPVPKAPEITQTITAEDLVGRLNERWAAINSLTAKVEFQASVSKSKEGVATDYPSVEGVILMRKPEMLRVMGHFTLVRLFDMASNGECFTLSMPREGKVLKGCGPSKQKSKNTWENLRPGFFFDAMLVRGLDADDLYSRVSESETLEDTARKHLITFPEYVLTISRRKPGSQQLTPLRVVTFHRDDLEPYQQDIYDNEGNLETEVFYQHYKDFEGGKFPSTVTIKRPLDEIQIVLTVEDVHQNQPLTDDQFVVQIPDGAKTQKVE